MICRSMEKALGHDQSFKLDLRERDNNHGIELRKDLFTQVNKISKHPPHSYKVGDYLKKIGKSLIFTLVLSQKSDFQPSTTKLDNIGHPTVKTG